VVSLDDYAPYVFVDGSKAVEGVTSTQKNTDLVKGFNYGKNWNALSDVIKYQIGNISNGFQMLEKGYINGFIGYKDSWAYVLKKEGWEGKFIKTLNIDSSSEYVVSMKGRGEHSNLLEVYSQGKRKIIENGTLDKLKLSGLG
jgi:polar amino acid transport system substrate-binding protein